MTSAQVKPLRRRFMSSTGVIVWSLLAACASFPEAPAPQGAAAVPAPVLKAGQYWEYAVRDAYTGAARGVYRYTVVRADADRILVEVTHDGELIDAQVYAPGWTAVEQPLTNLQRFRYDPPFPAYEFPLYPGKSWRRVVRASDPATGKTYRVHVHASVGGWRRVRVPAGEFDALEVTRYVYAGNAEFFRLQEEIMQRDWYTPLLGYVAVSEGNSSHIDTSRSGGGRGRPLRVRGDWLIAELVHYSL
jgi:hypothetical protein